MRVWGVSMCAICVCVCMYVGCVMGVCEQFGVSVSMLL